MLAIVGSLLLQVPPDVALLSVLLPPTQALSAPVIAAGSGSTVTTAVLVQPEEVSLNVIVVVPADTPVTTPVDTLIVATPGVLLAHVPVPSGFVSVVVDAGHMVVEPAIALIGTGVTVVVAFDPQLVLAVAVTVYTVVEVTALAVGLLIVVELRKVDGVQR